MKVVIAKKEHLKYKAFPTIVKTGQEFLVAFREGQVDNTKPHGKDGCVKFAKSKDLKE